MLCDARRPAPRSGTPAVVPGVGSVGHVVRRRLDAATIGAVPPRGAARRQPAESTVDRMISGPQWTPGYSAVPPDGPQTLPGCRTCRAGSSSRRVLRTGRVAQPPSGRHGPRTARRSVCRAAHLVGRRARPSHGIAVPSFRAARPETAVSSYPRGTARLQPAARPLPAGCACIAPCRPTPVRTARPLTGCADPCGRCAPRPPCRPIPVGRHGS